MIVHTRAVLSSRFLRHAIYLAVTSFIFAPRLAASQEMCENDLLGSNPSQLTVFEMDGCQGSAWRLFRKLKQHPGHAEIRQQLAYLYSEQRGYETLSSFFSATAAFLKGMTLSLGKKPGTRDFVNCSIYEGPFQEARERANAGRDAADILAQLAAQPQTSSLQLAVVADRAIQEHGNHCLLLAEWSLATLSYYSACPEQVDPPREELAIRLLITLTESGSTATSLGGTAPMYLFLSEYFTNTGDFISAYMAARLANQRLAAGSPTGTWAQGDFSEVVAERAGTLEELAMEMKLKSNR